MNSTTRATRCVSTTNWSGSPTTSSATAGVVFPHTEILPIPSGPRSRRAARAVRARRRAPLGTTGGRELLVRRRLHRRSPRVPRPRRLIRSPYREPPGPLRCDPVSMVRAGADVTEPASPAPGGSRARALAGGAHAPAAGARVHGVGRPRGPGRHRGARGRHLRRARQERGPPPPAARPRGGGGRRGRRGQPPVAAPSGAVLAETTNGSPTPFMTLMTPIVKTGQPFVSASLWPKGTATSTPLVVAGKAPLLADEAPGTVRAFLDGATQRSTFSVRSLLDQRQRRLGYAFAAGPGARYVVYAEASLPRHRRARIAAGLRVLRPRLRDLPRSRPAPGALTGVDTRGTVCRPGRDRRPRWCRSATKPPVVGGVTPLRTSEGACWPRPWILLGTGPRRRRGRRGADRVPDPAARAR